MGLRCLGQRSAADWCLGLGIASPRQPCIVGLPLRFLSQQATLWCAGTICWQGIR